MQQSGLYEKFPHEATILFHFKKYLTTFLQGPQRQQEVRSNHILHYSREECILLSLLLFAAYSLISTCKV